MPIQNDLNDLEMLDIYW